MQHLRLATVLASSLVETNTDCLLAAQRLLTTPVQLHCFICRLCLLLMCLSVRAYVTTLLDCRLCSAHTDAGTVCRLAAA